MSAPSSSWNAWIASFRMSSGMSQGSRRRAPHMFVNSTFFWASSPIVRACYRCEFGPLRGRRLQRRLGCLDGVAAPQVMLGQRWWPRRDSTGCLGARWTAALRWGCPLTRTYLYSPKSYELVAMPVMRGTVAPASQCSSAFPMRHSGDVDISQSSPGPPGCGTIGDALPNPGHRKGTAHYADMLLPNCILLPHAVESPGSVPCKRAHLARVDLRAATAVPVFLGCALDLPPAEREVV